MTSATESGAVPGGGQASRIAVSESQRALFGEIDSGRLLDFLPTPVVLQRADGSAAWLNAAARELDDWLKEDDPSRSLIGELREIARHAAGDADMLDGGRRILTAALANGAATRTYRASVDSTPASASARVETWILTLAGDGASASVLSEITRARLEEAQRQLLQADRMSTIGQLAAGVAHEINNPIGYVQSNLETLRDYITSLFRLIATQDGVLRQAGTLPATQLKQVEQVRHEIDYEFVTKDLPTLLKESQEGIGRVRKIIQDLREFSRAGHQEEWTFSDLHAGIDSTINIVWNELKYKVELIKQYGDLPPVECLPSQLNQVFMNILVNAGQAIESRGQITITTRADDDHVYVAISDNGKGIAAEHLPRVFEPFFTTKPVGKGTGLGLSISYGIVRKHGGEVDVRSEPGVGTTFVIKLPVRQPATGAEASDATQV
jgi:signal transduction histidine kinase